MNKTMTALVCLRWMLALSACNDSKDGVTGINQQSREKPCSGKNCDDAGSPPPPVCARCGDGVLDIASGEACDTAGDTATCDRDCTTPQCGDGYVNGAAGEQCDPGPSNMGSSFCDPDCTIAKCGDGLLNVAAGEECDDGNDVDDDGCRHCRLRSAATARGQCRGEQCDDGNHVDGDGCSATCQNEL